MTRTLPPVALASLAAATQAAVVRGRRPTPLSLLGAGLLAAPSIYLLTGSVRRFRRLGTTVDPRDGAAPSALVTTGPNAWSRNPMYAGMVGLLLAHSAVRRSAPAVIPAALFGLWIDLTQIASEEQQLAARFGPQFDAYRRRVRRWLCPARHLRRSPSSVRRATPSEHPTTSTTPEDLTERTTTGDDVVARRPRPAVEGRPPPCVSCSRPG